MDRSSATKLAGSFCFEPTQAVENLLDVFGPYSARFMGVGRFTEHQLSLGVAAAWPLLAVFVAVTVSRVAWRLRTAGPGDLRSWPRFPVFLVLVGLQSFTMYAVSRCGDLSTLTARYSLLGVFVFVGLAGLHLALDGSRWWRGRPSSRARARRDRGRRSRALAASAASARPANIAS